MKEVIRCLRTEGGFLKRKPSDGIYFITGGWVIQKSTVFAMERMGLIQPDYPPNSRQTFYLLTELGKYIQL